MDHRKQSFMIVLFTVILACVNVRFSRAEEAPAPTPAVQPLGNLTKEMPDERYEHLKEAKAKVDQYREKGNIAQALKAQRDSLKIAQEEFGGNKLIMLEEMLVLTDLLQQQNQEKEAGELLTEIGTLMDACSECPAPFLEGLRKRAEELHGSTGDQKNGTVTDQ